MSDMNQQAVLSEKAIPLNDTSMETSREKEAPNETYCYICEDGGSIVDCAWCKNSCCYNIIGQQQENPANEPEACVSIPESMISGADAIFPCPKCVADRRLTSIGYFINRGARATTRISPRTSVAIIIYHLNAYNALAKSLSEQLNAALSSFLMTVACQTRLIHRGFTESEADAMFDELPRELGYHLAVIFMTEGDPSGGWWHTVDYGSQKDSQVSEHEFLGTCLGSLRKMAKGAISARVFGISCGFNLKAKGTMAAIVDYLERLKQTLHRTWGKSKEAHTHSGLVIMDRSDLFAEIKVWMILYAPVILRPLGVPLPVAHTLCGCPEERSGWGFKKELHNPPELELQVGIHPDQRRQTSDYEVTLMEEPWNRAKGRFTFNESKNVRMKILPPNPEGKPGSVDRRGMWTSSGRRAVKKQMELEDAAE
ncbi:hypothetical protein FRC11_014265 [Ceratobasidium sp. 423]|nr:hypothetical protein FRC11_014265 [Ceratobasidium sp. 423]